jgi:hypothetical protein
LGPSAPSTVVHIKPAEWKATIERLSFHRPLCANLGRLQRA